MTDAKPKHFLTLDLRCGCGASLFVECPQEAGGYSLCVELTKLGNVWTQAHAAHHQEPKK